jgi:hypothetical protein
MSNRYHNKFHRTNHHSDPTAGSPDSSHDPIASQASPFKGDFVLKGALSASAPLSAYAGYFFSNGKSIISESPSGDNGDINIDEFGNTNVVYPTMTDGYVAIHSQGNVLVDNSLSANSLWTNTLYANSAVILVTDMHINELSGFTVVGPDYRQNVPASIDPNTEPLLFLQGIGISGTSWASFEGDIKGNVIYSADGNSLEWDSAYTTVNANSASWGTGDCVLTDCISSATFGSTAINVWNNLDMNGYSISGIGGSSLAFENGSKIEELVMDSGGGALRGSNTLILDNSSISRDSRFGSTPSNPFGTPLHLEMEDGNLDWNITYANKQINDGESVFANWVSQSDDGTNPGSTPVFSFDYTTSGFVMDLTLGQYSSGGKWCFGKSFGAPTAIRESGSVFLVNTDDNNGSIGVESNVLAMGYVSGSDIYSHDGDSSQWNSTYTTVGANSGSWIGGGGGDLSEVAAASGDWNSTYTTVSTNSAQWTLGGDLSEIAAASGGWNGTETTVADNSANWNGNKFSITVGAGINTLNFTTTADNNGVFYDLTIKDGLNARASNVMSTWSDAGLVYTETATTDLGDTSPIVISLDIAGGGNAQLVGTVASGSWTIDGVKRVI